MKKRGPAPGDGGPISGPSIRPPLPSRTLRHTRPKKSSLCMTSPPTTTISKHPLVRSPRARQARHPHRRLNWTHLPSLSASRATDPSTMMRTSSSRALLRTAAKPSTLCRAASGHAISNPTLANIEKRWESMPSREQADLWMALRDRMKENWNDLTLAEKKAGESRHCPTDDNTQHPRSRRSSQNPHDSCSSASKQRKLDCTRWEGSMDVARSWGSWGLFYRLQRYRHIADLILPMQPTSSPSAPMAPAPSLPRMRAVTSFSTPPVVSC